MNHFPHGGKSAIVVFAGLHRGLRGIYLLYRFMN